MKQDIQTYKFLTLLSTLCTLFLVLGVTLQDRLITLGSIYICGTVFVYPLTGFLLDIIAEVYGYKIAKQSLWITILGVFLFTSIITIVSKLPSPAFDLAYSHYFSLTTAPMFRTMAIGSIAIIIGQFINIRALLKLKILTKTRFFAFRSVTSTIIGETVTAVISLFGIFSQQINLHQIFIITVSELFVMFLIAFVLSFPGSLLVMLLKNKEPFLKDSEKSNLNPLTLKVN